MLHEPCPRPPRWLLGASRLCALGAIVCLGLAWWAWPWLLAALALSLLALLGAGQWLERWARRR